MARNFTSEEKKMVYEAAIRTALVGYINDDSDIIDDMDAALYNLSIDVFGDKRKKPQKKKEEYWNLNTKTKVKSALRVLLKELKD